MQKYLNEIIKSKSNGLVIIQVPTGYGKTYEIAKKMKALADDKNESRKIIYLTTLNKNLPDDLLRTLYGEDIKAYEQQVLRIRANLDEVIDKIFDIDIPDDFQNERYENIIQAVKQYKDALKNKINDKSYLEELKRRVSIAEKVFRKELTKKLGKEFKTKEERLSAIKTSKKYKWIGKLYPAVFTDSHQVLLMSVSKFLKKNSTLVEPSYEFIKAEYINDAIIFIDEFDASKNVILSEIISRSIDMKNDYLSLFRHISRTLQKDQLSSELLSAAEQVTGKYSLQSLIDESMEIQEKYYTSLSYKVAETSADHRQNFLLKDNTFHSILQKGSHYVRAAKEEAENRVLIYFENKEDFYSNRKDDDIVIYSLLRDISSYLNHFRIFIFSWGENYRKLINEKRSATLINEAMTLENAMASILNKIDLDQRQQKIILGEICGTMVRGGTEELLPDSSFYQRGMEIFSFKDHNDHNDFTALELVQIFDTPEKILLYLAQKALVFGVSATADIPTVVGNYDLSYIREQLEENYMPMDEDLTSRIKKELENKWRAYSDGRIQIYTKILEGRGKTAFLLEEECSNIFDKEEYVMAAVGQITQKNINEYFQKRYCNIIKTIHDFMKNPNINSMLYMGMALPKKGNPEMDEELIDNLVKLVLKDLEINDNVSPLVILRGENFDEQKERLMRRLADGEKLYIISSYMTIGAGQNLQYAFNDKSKYVELIPYKDNGDKRHFMKDIDALYLGEITNITANTFSEKNLSEEELLSMLFQIEELYYAGEINFKQAEEMMKAAFEASNGKRTKNVLSATKSVKLQTTQMVLQAVGRLCRTHIKSPEIYLYIDEKLLDTLDEIEISRRILPPEMKALLELKKSIGKMYSNDETKILNVAERISSNGNWMIHQLLSRDWNKRSMEIWKALREIALAMPIASTSTYENNELIKKLYITSGKNISEYLYSQYADFTDVVIDFETDIAAFKNSGRAKQKIESDEPIVQKVSAKDAKLDMILKYPGMQELFKSKAYATEFKPDRYIMSPVIFHNIYKGALGEVAGRYILERERGIKLYEITEPEKFEFFDFEMSRGVYVDFKNWKLTYPQNREKSLKEISEKLDYIGGKRVYIINVVASDDYQAGMTLDERIIEIPALINNEGNIIPGILDKIKREDYEQ